MSAFQYIMTEIRELQKYQGNQTTEKYNLELRHSEGILDTHQSATQQNEKTRKILLLQMSGVFEEQNTI